MLWLTFAESMRSVSVGRAKFCPLIDPVCDIRANGVTTPSYALRSAVLQENAIALAIDASM